MIWKRFYFINLRFLHFLVYATKSKRLPQPLETQNKSIILLFFAFLGVIFSENGVVRAFLREGKSVSINHSLNDLEQQLNPDVFFRVNRQYIINISFIEKLTKFFNYKMIIKLYGFTDLQIIVSKERISQLKSWLDRWRNKEAIGHRDLPGIQIPPIPSL